MKRIINGETYDTRSDGEALSFYYGSKPASAYKTSGGIYYACIDNRDGKNAELFIGDESHVLGMGIKDFLTCMACVNPLFKVWRFCYRYACHCSTLKL